MVKNFLFHRVNPQRDLLWDPMDTRLFDKCINYITDTYKVVLLEDLVQNHEQINPQEKVATIVFDDGYQDNIKFALPILDKYNVKASFYIVTSCIDNNVPTWTYILDYNFQKTKKTEVDMMYDFLPADLQVSRLATHNDRIKYVRKLKPALKRLGHYNRAQVLQTIQNAFDDVRLPNLMMSWDDIRTLRYNGHYIGSHTVTHNMLGTMESEEEITAELEYSGNRIKQQIGYFPLTISYPVGSYNDTTIRLSKLAGYKIGLAVKQLPYEPDIHNCFEIPRIELYNESWLKTRLRIDNFTGRLSKLFRRR